MDNAYIANSYLAELNLAESAYLYLDHGAQTVTVLRDSDGSYPAEDPETVIRFQIPAAAELPDLMELFEDEDFMDVCWHLCNIGDQEWEPIAKLFMLILLKYLPGFDINQDGETMRAEAVALV